MLRIAFVASNNGSSFRAISQAIHRGDLKAVACLVVSDRPTSAALKYAQEEAIPSIYIPTQPCEDTADEALRWELQNAEAELIVLSGYLRKLGPRTLTTFEGRILNVHPALLPRFGGKGMYGRKVHQAVFDAGESVTGATIHLVDSEYDHGRAIASRLVDIDPSDAVEDIERKVMKAECDLIIETVRRVSCGDLKLPL